MSSADPVRPRPTVFLSYASEDRPAARLIGETLPGYGLEVWYDESELGGGDAWDQKIRKQIRECDYFMPLISAQTEARHEGYFRREWRLAVERTLDMADDHPFLLPIVIDATDETRARVPEKFFTVQWLRVPGGRATPALQALCRRLVAAEPSAAPTPKRTTSAHVVNPVPSPASATLEFPRQEPGQRLRFWVEVLVWTLRMLWTQFRRLPRWIRALLIVWLVFALVTRGCTPRHVRTPEISPDAAARLKSIASQYQGKSSEEADAAKLAAQIAREFSSPAKEGVPERAVVLAVPFAAPAGDAAGAKLADSAFAQLYGRIAISQHGHLGMAKEALPTCDLAGLVERGRAADSRYVLCGTVETRPSGAVLTVRIASPSDNAFLWSKSYPVQGTDPTTVAADVDAKLTALDDD
jgi:hypothetical protein